RGSPSQWRLRYRKRSSSWGATMITKRSVLAMIDHPISRPGGLCIAQYLGVCQEQRSPTHGDTDGHLHDRQGVASGWPLIDSGRGATMDLKPRRFGNTVVLSPSGRIDHATSEEFKVTLLEQVGSAAGKDPIVLDLGGVEYIASTGLRALMLASRQAKAQGSTLVAAALQPLGHAGFH